jgi:GNAT superfamily N-acetyltransferase
MQENTGNELVVHFSPAHPDWQALVAHLRACDQARWVLGDDNLPKEDNLVFLGIADGEEVVANLSLKKQAITMPASEWAGERDRRLLGMDGEPLLETFVQTFFVDEDQRRKGYGLALQQEALEVSAQLGCIQMRSWSSLDKSANYQLKLKLGFAFHPEIQETPSGLRVSGGYFVKRVD